MRKFEVGDRVTPRVTACAYYSDEEFQPGDEGVIADIVPAIWTRHNLYVIDFQKYGRQYRTSLYRTNLRRLR